ncbi:gamma-glutamyl-gamma-aminobutyrate hydrolase family protein [Candidatus Nitrospira bockiana]
MRPIIGVTPDFNAGDREDMGGREPTYFLRARYVRAIQDAGGIPLILPLTADRQTRRSLLEDLHGVLLTGSGPDLPPRLYGERQRYPFRVVSRDRYDFELEMARRAAEEEVPLLGICGGMQAMNVALGGTLIQDIDSETGTPLSHRSPSPATRLCHRVEVTAGTLLHRISGRRVIRVNSSHHQSVKRTAPSLLVSGVAPDGIIEAIELRGHPFFLGVQWHPEFLYERHELHRRLFHAFLKAAKTRAARADS